MNDHRAQTGSALVIGIIIAVVVILGALGYVVWREVGAGDEVSNSSQTTQEQSVETTDGSGSNLRYTGAEYAFEYPQSWTLTVEQYGVDDDMGPATPVIKTRDFEANVGMGINTGAQVSIFVTSASESLADLKQSAIQFANGAAKNVTDTTVDGVDAFSYSMSYEGERYHTVFIYRGVTYDITYQYADAADADVNMDGYESVVSSFTFNK